MLIQSKPHLSSVVLLHEAKLKEINFHIKFWEDEKTPYMVNYVKKLYNYQSVVEVLEQAKKDLEKINNAN